MAAGGKGEQMRKYILKPIKNSGGASTIGITYYVLGGIDLAIGSLVLLVELGDSINYYYSSPNFTIPIIMISSSLVCFFFGVLINNIVRIATQSYEIVIPEDNTKLQGESIRKNIIQIVETEQTINRIMERLSKDYSDIAEVKNDIIPILYKINEQFRDKELNQESRGKIKAIVENRINNL